MRHTRLLVFAAFLLCFVAGGATMYAVREVPLPRRATNGSTLPDAFAALELTEDQRRQLEAVFQKYQPRTDSVIQSLVPRLAALADAMDKEIAAVLTPDQRSKLESSMPRPVYLLRRKTPEGVRTDTLLPR